MAAPDSTLKCLQATDGDVLWSVNLNQRFGGSGTDFGYSCSPTVVDGKVVMPVGGPGASMVALDARDGSVIWAEGDDAASYTPAYPITLKGKPFVLGYLQNVLVCHNLESGKLRWRYRLSQGYDEHAAWPIYREPYLWISAPFKKGCELLDLQDMENPPRLVWKSRILSNDFFSSVLVDGALYGFDVQETQANARRSTRGSFRCIDFESGSELWSIPGSAEPRRRSSLAANNAGLARIGHSSVTAADNKLIIANDTGHLIVASVSKSEYRELARVRVFQDDLCWTRPALANGRLFMRNHRRAVCVYLAQRKLPGPTLSLSELPTGHKRTFPANLLGVPKATALRMPGHTLLRRWYFISLAGYAALWILPLCLIRDWNAPNQSARYFFHLATFCFGAFGTTLISRQTGVFIFTWPLCLFVAFQWLVDQSIVSKRNRRRVVWAFLYFLATVAAYFLICRITGLVHQWAFLYGFAMTLPLSWLHGTIGQMAPRRRMFETLCLLSGFSVFFWSGSYVMQLFD